MSEDPVREFSPIHEGGQAQGYEPRTRLKGGTPDPLDAPYSPTNPMPNCATSELERDVIYRDGETGLKMSDIHSDVEKDHIPGLSETEKQVLDQK